MVAEFEEQGIESGIPGPTGYRHADSYAEEAARLFVESLRNREADSSRRSQAQITDLRWQENVVFVVSIIGAVASLALVSIGVLFLFTGTLASASLSGGMAVFSGAGTAGLRVVGGDLRQRRDRLMADQEEESQTLRAVGVALMMPSGELRNAALSDLASRMAKHVAAERKRPDPTVRRTRGSG